LSDSIPVGQVGLSKYLLVIDWVVDKACATSKTGFLGFITWDSLPITLSLTLEDVTTNLKRRAFQIVTLNEVMYS